VGPATEGDVLVVGGLQPHSQVRPLILDYSISGEKGYPLLSLLIAMQFIYYQYLLVSYNFIVSNIFQLFIIISAKCQLIIRDLSSKLRFQMSSNEKLGSRTPPTLATHSEYARLPRLMTMARDMRARKDRGLPGQLRIMRGKRENYGAALRMRRFKVAYFTHIL
jgi:hypothetical protein